ncbi:Dicarboxylic amino acid permease [Penicillium macrosclerotiorum]|uniref:Dicarboxylic amino acid permease n=1 Tax=Penicillium macrosclerotiorum TaxID=303699 RepID=UPI0025465BA8|nr:Dicarboxylic amino acid permease [Penicillium macrosclerotiorum]KAJ5669032.1 Dicarboxylic amino acid permease [Penicillium macrosclerotiorum]
MVSQLKAEGFSTDSPVKREYSGDEVATAEEGGLADPNHVDLHRALKARHITMIAIGGAIGTGLIIGTGEALAKAGPGAILIAYAWVGFIVYLVMCALGEMAAWLPLPSGFTGYAVRFCDPALGFTLGWTYWFKYIILSPNQLTAGALVIQYWLPQEKVNAGVWITIFLIMIVCINYFGVRFFGEFEFWLSSFKVVVIIGIILLSFILMLGGGPDHDRKGFRYWKNPGAFNTYIETGDAGRFLAFWSTMVSATFAYLGTELVGVTVGEAQNPRKTIPRAIKLTFFRILFFYVLSVLLVGTLVPYNDKKLAFAVKASSSAAASPFVVAIENSGIPVLSHIMNACILLFVFSASNSDLYIATRTIYGLAREGKAPKIFARTDRRGVPVFALGISSLFALLAYMNVSSDSKTVFKYFVNLVSMFGLLTWISILVTHIHFVRARRAQNVPDSELAYVAPFGIYGSYGALGFCVLIALTKNYDVFTHNAKWGNFDYKNFITAYLGIPLYLILLFGYKFITKCEGVKPSTANLFEGKDEIDREEAAFLARKAAEEEKHTQSHWFYRTFVSWLF